MLSRQAGGRQSGAKRCAEQCAQRVLAVVVPSARSIGDLRAGTVAEQPGDDRRARRHRRDLPGGRAAQGHADAIERALQGIRDSSATPPTARCRARGRRRVRRGRRRSAPPAAHRRSATVRSSRSVPAMRSSRHCSRAGPAGTVGRGGRAPPPTRACFDLVGRERAAPGSRGRPAVLGPRRVNSAATADAVAARPAAPSVGQHSSSAHSRLHQRPSSIRSRSRTRCLRRRARSATIARSAGSAGSGRRHHEDQLVGGVGHGVVPHRRQPRAVVVGTGRQVQSLRQRDATVLEPHGDRTLPGMEPQQVRHGGDRARRGCAGRGGRVQVQVSVSWRHAAAAVTGAGTASAFRWTDDRAGAACGRDVSRRWTAGRRPTTRARPGVAGAGPLVTM